MANSKRRPNSLLLDSVLEWGAQIAEWDLAEVEVWEDDMAWEPVAWSLVGSWVEELIEFERKENFILKKGRPNCIVTGVQIPLIIFFKFLLVPKVLF